MMLGKGIILIGKYVKIAHETLQSNLELKKRKDKPRQIDAEGLEER